MIRLTDCFIDVVAYIVQFLKTVSRRQPSIERVRADIQRLVGEGRELFDAGSFSMEDYDEARFAVFAWIDETISGSAWREKQRWRDQTLQNEYYRTTRAGEQFFERMNRLEARRGDVRDVYHLCLALGFEGRHGQEGEGRVPAALKALNRTLPADAPPGIPSMENDTLFPDAYQIEFDDAGVLGHERPISTFTMLCIGIPLLVFVALFLLFSLVLNHYGETILIQVI